MSDSRTLLFRMEEMIMENNLDLLIKKDQLEKIRAVYPETALKLVLVDPFALTEEELEDHPGVVIRRLNAKDLEDLKIESISEPKNFSNPQIADKCIIQAVGLYSLDQLLKQFIMFRQRIIEQIYIFSGLADPLVNLLPRRAQTPLAG